MAQGPWFADLWARLSLFEPGPLMIRAEAGTQVGAIVKKPADVLDSISD